MARYLTVILLCCIAIALLSCGEECVSTRNDPRPLTATETRLVQSYNAFGFKLLSEIVSNQTNKNIILSPVSVSMALGMTMNGSAGSTEEAMKSTLEFSGLTMEEIDQCYCSLIALLRGLDQEVRFDIAN